MVSRSLRTCSAVLRHKINITERLNRGRQWEINHRIPLGKLRIIPSSKSEKNLWFHKHGKNSRNPRIFGRIWNCPERIFRPNWPVSVWLCSSIETMAKKKIEGTGFRTPGLSCIDTECANQCLKSRPFGSGPTRSENFSGPGLFPKNKFDVKWPPNKWKTP